MCGINLIYAFADAAPPVNRDELRRTRDAMSMRGPDDSGEWHSPDGRLSLGHRRLSIIDLSEHGHQPMLAPRALAIVFNGEIYNYRELRAELERAGRTFHIALGHRGAAAMFAREREAMLTRLRGMFAFAMWDARERSLFLARDPYGIKPLYYADRRGTLRFASQVKALLAGGGVSREIDPAGAAGFFPPRHRAGAVHDVSRHPRAAGRARTPRSTRTATLSRSALLLDRRDAARSRRRARRALRARRAGRSSSHDAVLESVRYHMVADVPVGAFLSAGIDSTAVVALARESGAYHDLTDDDAPLRRSIAAASNDEAPLARARARAQYGVRHVDPRPHPRRVSRRAAAHLRGDGSADRRRPQHLLHLQGGARARAESAMSAAPAATSCSAATRRFATSRAWMPVTSRRSRVPGLGDGVPPLQQRAGEAQPPRQPEDGRDRSLRRDYAGAYLVKRGRFLAAGAPRVLRREIVDGRSAPPRPAASSSSARVTPDPGNAVRARRRARIVATSSRNQLLRDMDWAAMAHSLEVRVPLVDAHLLRKIAPVIVAAHDYEKSSSPPRPPRRCLPRSSTAPNRLPPADSRVDQARSRLAAHVRHALAGDDADGVAVGRSEDDVGPDHG